MGVWVRDVVGVGVVGVCVEGVVGGRGGRVGDGGGVGGGGGGGCILLPPKIANLNLRGQFLVPK